MRVRLESFGTKVAIFALAACASTVAATSARAQDLGQEAGQPSGIAGREGAPNSPGDSTETALNDLTHRIIGGRPASFGQFPSIVALVDAGLFSPADRQFCGGSVVGDRWVVTAAHCMHDADGETLDPSTFRVIEQVLDLRAETVDEEVVVVNVIVHPEYDHGSEETYNDIALLELATELDSPAARLFEKDPEDFSESEAIIAGWGATEYSSSRFAIYPDALQFASVPLVSRPVCNAPESYDFIREGQMCAGFIEGGVDSCLGDSGGPLYTEVNGRTELIGVTSFGRGCAEENYYGIYTSVSSYLDWMDQFVKVSTLTRDAGQAPPTGPGPAPGSEPEPNTDPDGAAGTDEAPEWTPSALNGSGAAGWPVLVLLAFAAVRRGAGRRF